MYGQIRYNQHFLINPYTLAERVFIKTNHIYGTNTYIINYILSYRYYLCSKYWAQDYEGSLLGRFKIKWVQYQEKVTFQNKNIIQYIQNITDGHLYSTLIWPFSEPFLTLDLLSCRLMMDLKLRNRPIKNRLIRANVK